MLHRFLPDRMLSRDATRLAAMMGLYFLVLFAVGILRPIKNALALDGLAESEFYKVYFVSAVVVFCVPGLNRIADRIPWRRVIPGTAAFFALTLLVFRAVYAEGSTALGMVFYGWYDLFAAALVTQFFMTVQVFFNMRDAKAAIPLVIAAGSLGATLGNLTTGIFAEALGTPNLLLLAALFIGAFAVVIPLLWTRDRAPERPGRRVGSEVGATASTLSEITRVFGNRHLRLIATLVLLTVVVKTVVDYEFNEAVRAYAGDLDAISSFQGYVFGAINWLPIVVLLPLGPLLKRFGVGLAVLLLPTVMLGATAALAVAFSVWTATVAKALDATFRYSAERTGREVLYVPVPTELKLKAKTYVDIALEKGIGKALSGVLILVLVSFMDYRSVTLAAVLLAGIWVLLAWRAKREYVATLESSIRGRFASFEDGFARLTERSTLALVENALRGDPVDVAFGLDLVEQAGAVDARPLADELDLLLDHPSPEIRARVLRLLTHFAGLVETDRLRERLGDPSETVREEAVAALVAAHAPDPLFMLRDLLASEDREVRRATLSWLVRGELPAPMLHGLGRTFLEARFPAEDGAGALARAGIAAPLEANGVRDPPDREELALTLGLLNGDPRAPERLEPLAGDSDLRVARAALRSAQLLRSQELNASVLAALAKPALREAARGALVARGAAAVDFLEDRMLDSGTPIAVRRQIPSALAHIPEQGSVRALLGFLSDGDSGRELRYRALKALNKLRNRMEEELEFPPEAVLSIARREVDAARQLARIHGALARIGASGPGIELLKRAVEESWEDRREACFRLLGLVYPPDAIYRTYVAVTRGDERSRTNALEWLEDAVGRGVFARIGPILDGRGPEEDEPSLPTLTALLEELRQDDERWLALLATWNQNRRTQERPMPGRADMDLIEKVFLLQNVDLLQEARSSHLALLASIAEEVELDAGEELFRRGEPNDSLYVVIRGEIELRGMGDQVLTARENTPFGTWALIDSDPSVVGARAEATSRLLRITRTEFQELMSDHPELAVGMLQGLARRFRSLVA